VAGAATRWGSRRILVRNLAERIVAAVSRPTLLAFEDLQWADELSLEVIGELARLGRDRPLFLLAAYRVDELPAGSIHREWRARLLSQRLAEEARLKPLTYEETSLVTTLILATGLPAPREVVNAVFERTDGIPLHIEELLGALDDEARADDRAIRHANVPDTIEDAVLARVGRLSDDARAVARAGAVIGRCFVPEVLAGIMDRPLADLDAPLAELVANAFLFPFAFVDRGYYDYRHQLLRDALYGTVPPSELRRLHARAGEFGAELVGASEIHASVHFERAGLKAQAFRTALAGADKATAVSSHREAFELYGRAVANAPDDLPPRELGSLYAAYADAANTIDLVDIARVAADAARRHYLAAEDRLAAVNAIMAQVNNDGHDARSVASRMAMTEQAADELATLPDTAGRESARAGVLISLGVDHFFAGRFDEARTTLQAARALAAEVGDRGSGMDAAFFLQSVDVAAGSPDGSLEGLLRLAREARDAGYESAGVTAYRNAALLAVRVMDYRSAVTGIEEGLRYADEIQQSYCRRLMAATSALIDWAAGRWDAAVAGAELELVERGSVRGGLSARHPLGYVAFGRGLVERARQLLDDALEGGRESGEIGLILPPLWGLAETALVAGTPAEAIDRCEEALSLAAATEERALLIPFVVTGVRANLAARQPEAVERWLDRLRAVLAGWEGTARPALDHADGLLRLSAGSTVAARTAFEAAIAGWDERHRIWEATWARLDLAACLVRGNRHGDALPLLTSVRVTADRLASPPLLARARDLEAVARSRGAEEEPWRPLTAREFEVARLIADGLTNAAIADELTLSPRTVGAHVEHILAKLGVTRRAEIAAWVTSIRHPAGAGARR
jgi:DNA-binding CsgD family transcriptional regulator